ncbi:hypothetical protein [Marinicella gelatinilytica]|uniref:hypothetical protein n=1 Tax=Marinicella gelatinilytica TaxID=2996017 RepID=UPI002260FFE8|nr:hypothetical protein [Marinicella gelatinilytica]MCX7544518.1 hypothetical protein [Marinicella gelatinilytica]
MNQDIINDKDEIIRVKCSDCHQQTIYLKIINAAINTQKYRSQGILCAQCQLISQAKKID